jgi:2-amino-4-hydroxy-6-hydroxymethyldihydropteridine diphosphokinase
MPGKTVYLSLGSNLGNREDHLAAALGALELSEITLLARSSLYETAPRDFEAQPWFLNQVVQCETRHFPLQLLRILLNIERQLGRIREAGPVRRGPRVIDIDILLYANVVMNAPRLIIPHPRMTERRFVLEPLLEIAPDTVDPATKRPLRDYRAAVQAQPLRLFKPRPSR